jgi:hypothetical protein
VSLKENHHHLLQDNSKARERIRGKKESIEFMEDMAQVGCESDVMVFSE